MNNNDNLPYYKPKLNVLKIYYGIICDYDIYLPNGLFILIFFRKNIEN